MAMNCWHCGQAIEVKERIEFRENCQTCDRALHVCRNCEFYDPSYNNQCRETMAERVVEKERANFCDFFAPARLSRKSGAEPGARSAAQAKLDALFKKKA